MVLHEHPEGVEDLRPQWYGQAVSKKTAVADVEEERAKLVDSSGAIHVSAQKSRVYRKDASGYFLGAAARQEFAALV
jgi:hypothetical protein